MSASVALYGRFPTNNRTDITFSVCLLRLWWRCGLLLRAGLCLTGRRGCVARFQHDDPRREPPRAVLVEFDHGMVLVDIDDRAGPILRLHHAISCRISAHQSS